MTDWVGGCQVRDLTCQLGNASPSVGSATRQARLVQLVYLTTACAQTKADPRRGANPLVTDTPP
jgi:hypothetical protein